MEIVRIGNCEICLGGGRMIRIEVDSQNVFFVCSDCVADLMSIPFVKDELSKD